jgi:hypothetical protein
MATASRSDSSLVSPPDTISGMAISLAFWLCLLFAAILFALVALSPKFFIYLQLRSQFDMNQRRLVGFEVQADQLQRVIDAIRNDKDFASELTRIEFDAVRPDEEVIPVEVALKLDARAGELLPPTTTMVHVWYEPFVKHLASDSSLRMSLLAAAALLVVVSFSLLQPAGAAQLSTGVRGCNPVWQSLRDRYVRQV